MKRLTAIILVLLFIPASQLPLGGAAPASPADQSIVFSSKTQLVTVPVIVTRSGQHVTGLGKDDFTILQDGKPQAIAHFEEITTAVPAIAKPEQQRRVGEGFEFSNVGPAYPTRFTIIGLDMTSTGAADQAQARKGLLKFLRENVSTREPIAVVANTRFGMRVIHDFTTDPAILVQALEKVWKMGSGAEAVSPVIDSQEVTINTGSTTDARESSGDQVGNEIRRFNEIFSPFRSMERERFLFQSVDAITVMARAYAGIPGRKSLIWVSSNPPFPPSANYRESLSGAPPLTSNAALDNKIAQALLELKNGNMAVYPVDAAGLVAVPIKIETPQQRYESSGRIKGGFGATTSSAAEDMAIAARNVEMANMAVKMRDPKEDMRWIAWATGGRASINRNDIAGSIARAMDDSTQYYQLTYYVAAETKTGWHKIDVKVKQPHVNIRARGGVLIDNLAARADAQRDVAQALGSPMELTAVPVIVRWTGQNGYAGEAKEVGFEVSVPPNSVLVDDSDGNHISLDITVLARNANQKLLGNIKRNLESHLSAEKAAQFAKAGLNFNSTLKMDPGRYSVKFLVRDNLSGRVGTVTAPLVVE